MSTCVTKHTLQLFIVTGLLSLHFVLMIDAKKKKVDYIFCKCHDSSPQPPVSYFQGSINSIWGCAYRILHAFHKWWLLTTVATSLVCLRYLVESEVLDRQRAEADA